MNMGCIGKCRFVVNVSLAGYSAFGTLLAQVENVRENGDGKK